MHAGGLHRFYGRADSDGQRESLCLHRLPTPDGRSESSCLLRILLIYLRVSGFFPAQFFCLAYANRLDLSVSFFDTVRTPNRLDANALEGGPLHEEMT